MAVSPVGEEVSQQRRFDLVLLPYLSAIVQPDNRMGAERTKAARDAVALCSGGGGGGGGKGGYRGWLSRVVSA